MQRKAPQFSHHNKCFINYVFCRNWAVRNPAVTRLDSSLVNKQVAECKQMVSIQEHLVYILQPTVHTAQRNWISRLGKNL